jgi:hypothetical protein
MYKSSSLISSRFAADCIFQISCGREETDGGRFRDPADVREASRLLGLAFADNPNTLAITRGDRAKARQIIQAGVSEAWS